MHLLASPRPCMYSFVHGEEGLAQALKTTEALRPGAATALDPATLEAIAGAGRMRGMPGVCGVAQCLRFLPPPHTHTQPASHHVAEKTSVLYIFSASQPHTINSSRRAPLPSPCCPQAMPPAVSCQPPPWLTHHSPRCSLPLACSRARGRGGDSSRVVAFTSTTPK